MPQKIAVAIVHGVGKQEPDFAEGMIEKLIARFAKETGQTNTQAGDALAFQPVYWAPALQKRQEVLWERLRKGGPLDFVSLRRFMVDFAADAIAYQPLPEERSIYDDIHFIFAEALHKLAGDAGEKAPLCVIAHSLGTIVASNYLYDLEKEGAKSKPDLIGKSVWNHIEDIPLECGDTFTHFYTMGSPIALWSLRYKNPDFGRPINVPSPRLKKHYPGLAGEWVNFYDEDDVIGYPLRTLNELYKKAVTTDKPINAGSWLSSWSPLSHNGYWTDKDVINPIASSLANTWKAVNS